MPVDRRWIGDAFPHRLPVGLRYWYFPPMSGEVVQHIAAGVYDFMMQPLERWRLGKIRTALLGRASGDVLEVGAGSGVNLRYYDPRRLSSLTVSDYSDRLSLYRRRIERLGDGGWNVPVTTAQIDAQRLPFPENSFDTVVATLVFCSVDCAPCGFDEILRVLRPDGQYLFLEHVRPTDGVAARAFDFINPVWNRLSGGCNLNRDTLQAMRDAGLTVTMGELSGESGSSWNDSGRKGVFVWGEGQARA